MRKKRNICRLLVFWGISLGMILGLEAQSSGASQTLDAFLLDNSLESSWDPFLNKMTFFRGEDYFSFQLDAPYGVFNGTRIVPFENKKSFSSQGRVSLANIQKLQELFPLGDGSDGRKITTIFIDPGHGGKDPGAIGRPFADAKKAISEKDVVLAVALNLERLLKKAYPDIKIILTRRDDTYISLDDRTKLANKYSSKSDTTLFVSIHANASINKTASGFEVWYLPQEYSRKLIKEEDYLVLDKSVLPLLNDIVQDSVFSESILLARRILEGLEGSVGKLSKNRGMKAEEWYVVRTARMPSILIELGFVTNEKEFLNLSESSYLNKLALGIYNGLELFINNYK